MKQQLPHMACTSHRLSAAASDAPHPAVFSHFGVLDVLSSTTPRPSGRKPNWARHLADLATKTGEKCRLVRHRRLAFTAAVLCALVAGAALAAPNRAAIRVVFRFEAPTFSDLEQADLAVVAERATTILSARANRRWGFLEWDSDPDSAPVADWIIVIEEEVLTVTDESGDVFADSVIRLEHSGVIGDTTFDFDQTEDRQTLYSWGQPKPVQDSTVLADDIANRLDAQLGELLESFEVEKFLEKIPLGRTVIADAVKERLVVPLKIEDLRADRESVLGVVFFELAEQKGYLELETAATVTEEGAHQGYVVGRILDVVFVGITIPPRIWWDPQVADLISNASDVRVFMFEYSPSLAGTSATEEGVVLDPDA